MMQIISGELSSILYVEDDCISREVVNMFLKDNYIVETASDSSEAMEKLRKNNYSAILLDISLCKGIGGLELAREIRKLKNYKKVPIIAVTAHAFKEDEKRILTGGCTHYISKPFNRQLLIGIIKKALSK
jgi:CheY-like chemotaxis protein